MKLRCYCHSALPLPSILHPHLWQKKNGRQRRTLLCFSLHSGHFGNRITIANDVKAPRISPYKASCRGLSGEKYNCGFSGKQCNTDVSIGLSTTHTTALRPDINKINSQVFIPPIIRGLRRDKQAQRPIIYVVLFSTPCTMFGD